MTDLCFYLQILKSFSEHHFYRTSPGNCLFQVQVAGFQPAYTIRKYPSKHINVDIWLEMKVEPTYIYRRCFNVAKTKLKQS